MRITTACLGSQTTCFDSSQRTSGRPGTGTVTITSAFDRWQAYVYPRPAGRRSRAADELGKGNPHMPATPHQDHDSSPEDQTPLSMRRRLARRQFLRFGAIIGGGAAV